MRSINLPTDLMRAFVSVIDLGGYTRAADALGRTQPAISLQMKRLEELLDAKLLDSPEARQSTLDRLIRDKVIAAAAQRDRQVHARVCGHAQDGRQALVVGRGVRDKFPDAVAQAVWRAVLQQAAATGSWYRGLAAGVTAIAGVVAVTLACLLAVTPTALYTMYQDGAVLRPTEPYAAVGSGEAVAIKLTINQL